MPTDIRLHIDARTPFAEGMSFGEVGPYERLSGRVSFALDPASPLYQGVVDLDRAPTNPDGPGRIRDDLCDPQTGGLGAR